MILGYYSGYLETDLKVSLTRVAWAAQYYGIEEAQFDPIIGSISHFLRRARSKGIWIQTSSERQTNRVNWNDILLNSAPCVFILAGKSDELSLSRILDSVEQGSNLVLLSSDEINWRAHTLKEKDELTAFYSEFYSLSMLSCKDEEIQVAPNGAGYRRAL